MLSLSRATLAMLARRSSESRGHSIRRTEAPQARQQGERITGKKGLSSRGMVLFTGTVATYSQCTPAQPYDGQLGKFIPINSDKGTIGHRSATNLR